MKVLIVDNERNIITGLISLLRAYCSDVQEIEWATDISSAKVVIQEFRPNLLFLDIELDEGTGIDLLNQIDNYNFQLIFITAYDQYAIEAFKYSAIDYLLKPIDPDDLTSAVQRAKEMMLRKDDQLKLHVLINNLHNLSNSDKKIIVSDKDNIYAVDINSILYLRADGPYTRIQRLKDYIFASKNLKHFESMLLYAGFYRVHHSYLANLSHMKRFDKIDNIIELSNGEKVPVSIRKKEGLLNAIKGSMLK